MALRKRSYVALLSALALIGGACSGGSSKEASKAKVDAASPGPQTNTGSTPSAEGSAATPATPDAGGAAAAAASAPAASAAKSGAPALALAPADGALEAGGAAAGLSTLGGGVTASGAGAAVGFSAGLGCEASFEVPPEQAAPTRARTVTTDR